MTANVVQLDQEPTALDDAWVDLPITRRMEEYLRALERALGIALFVTGPGLGKTETIIRCFQDGLLGALLTLNPANGNLRYGITALYHAVGGVAVPLYRSGSKLDCIAIALAEMGSAERIPVLVVDEAQFGSVRLLEYFRSLHDKGLCSLALAANDLFDFRRKALQPLLRRLAFEVNVPVARHEDIAAFLDARRIVAPKSRELLFEIAGARGIAGIDDALRRAREIGGKAVPSLGDLEATRKTMRFLTAPDAPAPSRRSSR